MREARLAAFEARRRDGQLLTKKFVVRNYQQKRWIAFAKFPELRTRCCDVRNSTRDCRIARLEGDRRVCLLERQPKSGAPQKPVPRKACRP